MQNWDLIESAKEANESKPAKVTPIKGGEPTKDELEKATDELFQELYFGNFGGKK